MSMDANQRAPTLLHLSRPLLVLGPAGAAEHPQAAHARTAGEDVVVLFNHRPLGSPPAAPPVLATVPPSFMQTGSQQQFPASLWRAAI